VRFSFVHIWVSRGQYPLVFSERVRHSLDSKQLFVLIISRAWILWHILLYTLCSSLSLRLFCVSRSFFLPSSFSFFPLFLQSFILSPYLSSSASQSIFFPFSPSLPHLSSYPFLFRFPLSPPFPFFLLVFFFLPPSDTYKFPTCLLFFSCFAVLISLSSVLHLIFFALFNTHHP